MAIVTARVSPGESVALYPASRCEPYLRYAEKPSGSPVDTQVAAATGVVSFTVVSRIEFYGYRATGKYIKLMDSTTRGTS